MLLPSIQVTTVIQEIDTSLVSTHYFIKYFGKSLKFPVAAITLY